MFKKHLSQLICLTLTIFHRYALASYASFPSVFNSPSHGPAFAAPLPCDSPPPLETYGAANPFVFAAHPVSYASSVPQFHYAAPVAPSYVKYGTEPRVKVTTGLPVTTTYTTAVGFAAPPPPVHNIGSPLAFAYAAAAPVTFGASNVNYGSGVAYAASPPFLGSATYAAPSYLGATPHGKKFHAPLPVTGYSYTQSAPNGIW
ncbi:PREDICTED: extensin-2 [Rhagoletis zephyria]|uniref:extensin-2 n=1 Tax=Rhagoletis zephyria TaxID=28612 RepID=UPI0008118AFA|nr:PREDICTED: extensin-2 [Rhagoletis zephyria]